MLLVNRAAHAPTHTPKAIPAVPPREVVFLPPPEVLRRLVPRPTERPAAPETVPTPPPARPKDRISIGAPSDRRAERLLLRREDDLTAVPRGRPDAPGGPSPAPRTAAVPPPPAVANGAVAPLRLPPGLGRGEAPRAADLGTAGRPGSLSESLRNLDR